MILVENQKGYNQSRQTLNFTIERDMEHEELFGILTNLIQVETGVRTFQEIQQKYPEFYDADRKEKWNHDAAYSSMQEYKPKRCENFCPYHKECEHGKNILSTVRPKRGTMERVSGYQEQFYSIEEVQDDTFDAISRAYKAKCNRVYVIKAMTSIGKSTSYLRLISENPECRFLVAAPTNLLKEELHDRARKLGINVRRTPSLEQIKDKIPDRIWEHIQSLYKSGQRKKVHEYIHEVLVRADIPCLRKYIKKREELKDFEGTLITTHNYLLNMNEESLRKYDAIIIDEDILFKSVISNQGEITVSELERISKETADIRLLKKIKKLLKSAKKHSCIEVDGFEWDEDNDENYNFDLPSFCLAERFLLRKASEEQGLEEDTFAYLKPVSFKDVKYIIVSATADETIYRNYFRRFGDDRVDFYECKKAEYMGVLKQYPRKSMSRTCIANNSGIVERIMESLGINEDKVITFKKENLGQLHFGNTEGSNTLEGKDILVVGTPYHTEFLYKLVAFAMDLDFDEDEKMKMQNVTHNGYLFRFTTFANENLRNIQFWMIESELEQAVGRARLLRHSCVVHLFSNFPLSQARMIEGFVYDKE